jgi:hypothetical protein
MLLSSSVVLLLSGESSKSGFCFPFLFFFIPTIILKNVGVYPLIVGGFPLNDWEHTIIKTQRKDSLQRNGNH